MNDAQPLRDLSDLLQELSEATGLSKSAVQSEVTKLDYVTYEFNGLNLVTAADFLGIVDIWAEQVKSDIHHGFQTTLKASQIQKSIVKESVAKAVKQTKSAKSDGKVAKKAAAKSTKSVTPKKTAPQATKESEPTELEIRVAKKALVQSTPKVTTQTTVLSNQNTPERRTRKRTSIHNVSSPRLAMNPKTAKKATKKVVMPQVEEKVVVSEMELPKGYRKRVSNRYGPTLQSVLPGDDALKRAYLNEIVVESNLGKSFLERVADSIKIKYRGKISSYTAYQGLLARARAM
ncbi:MAG: hypothetical protein HC810_05245 [Acaryochloridaceae cyanobacterium RL_2_7]|nr:hypothetical protein [Acaryochloridaceae cyanobacterium RL_2_7]